MTLAEMLRQHVEAFERVGMPRERSLEWAILEHGQAYEVDREASAEYGQGFLKDCFENAAKAALWHDELTYVEGFAYHGLLPVHHAWVITEEGKAVEVTWRDGGNECGFCIDGERHLTEGDEGYDPEDERTWYATCPMCRGSNESDYEHNTLEDAQYYGIAVDRKTLYERIKASGTWGVFDGPDDLAAVLDARSA